VLVRTGTGTGTGTGRPCPDNITQRQTADYGAASTASLPHAWRTPNVRFRTVAGLAAQIQRLGAESARLREALEASSNITRVGRVGSR
jgi:hypothetical protein